MLSSPNPSTPSHPRRLGCGAYSLLEAMSQIPPISYPPLLPERLEAIRRDDAETKAYYANSEGGLSMLERDRADLLAEHDRLKARMKHALSVLRDRCLENKATEHLAISVNGAAYGLGIELD